MKLIHLMLMLALSLTVEPTSSQMLSPFLGQGLAQNTPIDWGSRLLKAPFAIERWAVNASLITKVHVSVLLDKLLKIDEQDYRFEAVLFVRMSWLDPRALGEILNRTRDTFDAGLGNNCKRECNEGGNTCCDSIWLPGLSIINAWGLPQDRIDYEYIFVIPNTTAIAWYRRFSGIFYTPMDFRGFPFDSQELVIDLWGQNGNHNLIAASTALKLGNVVAPNRKFVDLSSWKVEKVHLLPYTLDLWQLIEPLGSALQSDPWRLMEECLQLSLKQGEETGYNTANHGGDWSDSLRIKIKIRRLYWYYVASYIVPLILCVVLSWLTFWISPRNIETRVTVLVAVFLSLTALQFTISNGLPASSYITALGWILIWTYAIIVVAAMETVVVYYIYRWYIHRQDRILSQEMPSMRSDTLGSPRSSSRMTHRGSEGPESPSEPKQELGNICEDDGGDPANRPSPHLTRPRSISHRMHQGVLPRARSSMLIRSALDPLLRIHTTLESDQLKAKEIIGNIENVSVVIFPVVYTTALLAIVLTAK